MPYSGQVKEVQIPDGTIWEIPSGGGSSVEPATQTPLMDGTGAVGTSAKYAREDHVHPSDTSKQDVLTAGTGISISGNTISSTVRGIEHLLDSSNSSGLRQINSIPEDASYTVGDDASAFGYNTKASGWASFAEGSGSEATGMYSHAEGYITTASAHNAHAEGYRTTAGAYCSHAEGSNTTASEEFAHAEGFRSVASGDTSHAEGRGTTASGSQSHAEGVNTTASGIASHAGGGYTEAASAYQTAIGKYNVSDPNDEYAFIVGNGASGSPSNAFSVHWDGRATLGALPTANMDATPKQYVDSELSAKQDVLTAGSNISISGNTISATDTKYTAGTNVQISAANVISATDTKYTAATATPLMDGTGAVGTSALYARQDHRHPTDTSRAPVATVSTHNISSNVNVANAVDTTIGDTGVQSAGIYLVIVHVSFASNTSGRRRAWISSSNTGQEIDRYSQVVISPASGAATQMTFTVQQTITANTTWYLRVYQNSGGTLAVGGGIRVVKIG